MEKITLNKETESKVRQYAQSRKISFQKACEKLFGMGVCHLLNQKKENNFSAKCNHFPFDVGVCHRPRVRKITIIEVEVA